MGGFGLGGLWGSVSYLGLGLGLGLVWGGVFFCGVYECWVWILFYLVVFEWIGLFGLIDIYHSTHKGMDWVYFVKKK